MRLPGKASEMLLLPLLHGGKRQGELGKKFKQMYGRDTQRDA